MLKAPNQGTRLYSVKSMYKALSEAGTVNAASKRLGCANATMRKYINENPILLEALEEARSRLVDKAENGLMALVEDDTKQGHHSAVFFTLSTLGKNKGYSKQVVIDHEVKHTLAHDAMTDAQLIELIGQNKTPPSPHVTPSESHDDEGNLPQSNTIQPQPKNKNPASLPIIETDFTEL